MPITVGHMQHVKNLLTQMKKKRTAGLHVKQSQCSEDTTDDIEKALAYVVKKIQEA